MPYIIAAALVLPFAVHSPLLAQSGPAGQITARSRSSIPAPESLAPIVIPNFADLLSGQPSQPNVTLQGPTLVSPFAFDKFSKALNDTAKGLDLNEEDRKKLQGQLQQQLEAANITPVCSTTAAGDQQNVANAKGTARRYAWLAVIALDNSYPVADPTTLLAARKVACAISDALDFDSAKNVVAGSTKALGTEKGLEENQKTLGQKGIDAIAKGLTKDVPACWATYTATSNNSPDNANPGGPDSGGSQLNGNASTGDGQSPTTTAAYHRPLFFPLFHKGCHDDAGVLNFFAAGHKAETATSVDYLYNAQQSASAITGDLVTSTFAPGFQAVLAGTATVGSGTSTNSTAASPAKLKGARTAATDPSSTTPSTDTVETALAKIQNGGDFNLRIPIPLMFHSTENWAINGNLSPNVGFMLNKFGGQQTITEANEYSGNFPAELYFQAGSIKDPSGDSVPAVGFFDARAAGEWISSALAQKLGLPGSSFFPIVQVSGGIEFAQRLRISLQYIYSTSQFCDISGSTSCSSSVSGTASTTSAAKINGFHLAVSFSPQKSKNQNSSN
jgi:hypothetical protein